MFLNVINKLVYLYENNLFPWLLAIFTFISTWLGDSKDLLLYIFIVVLVDTIVGITRSIKNGNGLKSSGIRSMLGKLLVYFTLVLITIILDKTMCFDSVVITRVATGFIIGSECFSILGNLSIIYPKLTAISLLKKLLHNEISDKLKIDKSELEQIMKNENKD